MFRCSHNSTWESMFVFPCILNTNPIFPDVLSLDFYKIVSSNKYLNNRQSFARLWHILHITMIQSDLIWSDLKANTVPGHGHYTVCVKDMTQCVEIQMFVCVEMVSVGELSSALWNVFSSNVRETEMLWSSALWFTEEFTSSTFIWNNNKLHSFSFSKQHVLQQKLLPLHWAAVAMWLLGCSEHRGQSKPFQQ